MRNFKIAGLDDNVTILGLGSLFRRNDGSSWGMNVRFSKNQDKSSLSISQAPISARKRVLNVTLESIASGKKQAFSVASAGEWKTGVIGDCSFLTNSASIDSRAYCFVFEIENDVTVYLPQFELARALFFHNAYLARSAIHGLELSAEFDVIVDAENDKVKINILPSSTCPLVLFKESGPRQLLSWILLDHEARQSYESIGKHQILHGWDGELYRKWNFQFEPPPLVDSKFEVRGLFDAKSKTFFVYEIDAIRNLCANIPTVIDIYHPKFKKVILGGIKPNLPPTPKRPKEHTNHDGEDANESTERVIIKIPSIKLQFDKAFKANKIAIKEVKPRGSRSEEDSADQASKGVSTEELSTDPGLPGAEFDGANDATSNDHLYESKFSYFLKMIEVLETNYDWVVQEKLILKLPEISGYSRHLLKSDQSHRCLAVVSIKSEKGSFVILELDMSDTLKSLSTLVLSIKTVSDWPADRDTVMTEIVKAPIRWPFEKLSFICGSADNYKGVPHPKSASDEGYILDSAALEHWAHRLDLGVGRIKGK